MAVYFYDKDGSNTSPYDTWTKACTSFATVLAAASSGTDIIVINKAGVADADEELSADTVWATANSVSIISATKDDTSTAYTPSAMGTDYWLGNSTTNRRVGLGGGADDRVFVYGLTFRTAGSTGDFMGLNYSNAADTVWSNCYFWHGNTDTGSHIQVGYGNSQAPYNEFEDCTFVFGSTSQTIQVTGVAEFYNCNFAPTGQLPTSLLTPYDHFRSALFSGCDLSALASKTLVPNNVWTGKVVLERCKLASSMTILASQTSNPTRYSPQVYVHDCNSGDTHLQFGYYDALGTIISETGIYYTSGAAAQSWKIVTTANTSFYMPFETPWIDLYHAGTSAITPYFEIVRSGSATAYQNDEIWAEFTAKTTSGSTKASAVTSDRKDIDGGTAAADQAAGAGTGSWTGENATSWSGKIDSGSALTPAETGYIRGRICVGEPSITVYVDPQIRT
jgi:hypothetical protein